MYSAMSAETVTGDFNVSFCIIFPIIQHYIDKKQCMTVLLKVEHLILINLEKCMILFSNGMKKTLAVNRTAQIVTRPVFQPSLPELCTNCCSKGRVLEIG